MDSDPSVIYSRARADSAISFEVLAMQAWISPSVNDGKCLTTKAIA